MSLWKKIFGGESTKATQTTQQPAIPIPNKTDTLLDCQVVTAKSK